MGKRGGKRGHQAVHEEIGSQTYHSTNTDDNHNTCDSGDENLRPTKRRKPRLVPTPPAPSHHQQHCLHSPFLTTSLEIDGNMLPQADRDRSLTSVDAEHCSTPQVSQRSVSAISAPVVEYQEWPFEGFLRCTKIGNETVYNIEFRLPHTPEHERLSPSNDSYATSRSSSSRVVASVSSVKIGRPRKVSS